MNQKLLGVAGIFVILAHRLRAFDQPKGHPHPRRRRRLRAAGVHRLACSLHELGKRGDPDPFRGRRQLARLCEPGNRVPVRPEREQSARPHLRHFGAAGDHLLREPGRHSLLPRDHAADRPLGRRRDRLGDRHQPRRIAVGGRQHFRRAVGIAAGGEAVPRRPAAIAAVHRHVRRHGRRRRHDPRGLREPAGRAATSLTCSPHPLCPPRAAS